MTTRTELINVGRSGVFRGLFGNPVVENTVSPQYAKHFRKVMLAHPEKVKWLKEQLANGAVLFCPGCGVGCKTCHARVIELELALDDY